MNFLFWFLFRLFSFIHFALCMVNARVRARRSDDGQTPRETDSLFDLRNDTRRAGDRAMELLDITIWRIESAVLVSLVAYCGGDGDETDDDESHSGTGMH